MEKLQVILHRVFVLAALLCVSISSNAQLTIGPFFNGGVIAGITTSQVDGDENAGFHCIGGFGGLFVERLVSQFSHRFELTFSQKGSADAKHTFRIATGYVDATYLFQLNPSMFFSQKAFELMRWKLGTSLSVKAYETVRFNDNLTQKANGFSRFDWQIVGGLDFRITDRLTFDCRASYSIIPIQDRFRNSVLWASLQWYLT